VDNSVIDQDIYSLHTRIIRYKMMATLKHIGKFIQINNPNGVVISCCKQIKGLVYGSTTLSGKCLQCTSVAVTAHKRYLCIPATLHTILHNTANSLYINRYRDSVYLLVLHIINNMYNRRVWG
jgi:hypothetical protein